MATAIEVLAQQIESLRREVAAMKSPQLIRSSLDNGAMTITQTSNGSQQVTGAVGVQFDGTSGAVTLAGPTPPTPTQSTVSTAIGGIKVAWDGRYVDPQLGFSSPVVAPLDWSAVDVQVSTDPAFPGNTLQLTQASFISAAGGDVFVSWPTSGAQVYVRLLTRSKAGKYSTPSATTGPIPTGLVQLGDLGFNVAQYGGGTTIYFTVHPDQPSAPSWGFTPGDLWLEQTGTSDGLNGNPTIGTPLYQTWRWLGSQWTLLQDQGISNSLASAIAAQALANSKVSSFTQSSPPDWTGLPGSAYWIDTSPTGGNVTKVWNGSGWTPYQLGNGAIQPNSLIASNVIATGTVTAALLETEMVLTNTLIAGDPHGANVTISPTGIQTYGIDQGSGQQFIATRLGNAAAPDQLAVGNPDGTIPFNVDNTGQVSCNQLRSATDAYIAGRLLQARLDDLPRGVVASAYDNSKNILGIGTTYGLGEVSFIQHGTRWYRAQVVIPHMQINAASAADQDVLITLRATSNGSAPTTTSPVVTSALYSLVLAGRTYSPPDLIAHGIWGPDGALIRILPTIAVVAGGGLVDVNTFSGTDDYRPYRVWVEDMGYAPPNTYVANIGSGSPSAMQTTTATWNATWSASYNGSNQKRTDTPTIMYQGNGADGYYGRNSALAGFNTTSIQSTLSGATINNVQINLYTPHWASISGGTAQVGLSADTSAPATLTGSRSWGVVGQQHFANGEGIWLSVPSAYWSGFASGTYAAVTLNAPDDTSTYYGYANGYGAPNAPQLKITYTK